MRHRHRGRWVLTIVGVLILVLDCSNPFAEKVQRAVEVAKGPKIEVQAASTSIQSGETYNYGTVVVESTERATIAVSNSGKSDLTLRGGASAVAVSGADATQFALSDLPTRATVPAGRIATFTLSFAPTSAGTKTATVTIESDDPTTAVFTFEVTGTGTYTGTVAMPTFSPGPGQSSSTVSVTVNCATAEATIYYTTDGSDPTKASRIFDAAAPILVAGNGSNITIRALGAKKGMANSAIASGTYTIDYSKVSMPTFSQVGPATFNVPTSLFIYEQDSGATIYYTVSSDGSTPPDPTSSAFDGSGPSGLSILVQGSGTHWIVKAMASNSGFADSAVVSTDVFTVLYTYPLSYDGNGSTSGSAPSGGVFPQGQIISVFGNTGNLAKTGYSFAGWNTAANGSGTGYVAGNTFSMPAGAVTLYAQWTINAYALSYNGNGSTGGSPPSGANYNYNQTVTVAGSNTLTRTGYSFAGWNTSANGSGTGYVAGNTFSMPAGAVTLYAQWAVNSYALSYIGNGSTSGSPPSGANYNYNQTVTVAGPNTLTRTGCSFTGWNTAANGSGTGYMAADTFPMPAGAVTLYAQWAANTYALSYNGNGNTSGSAPSGGSYTYGQTVTVVGPGALARTGYSFSGWNTAANGSGTGYVAGNTFSMPAATVTLYAQWILNSYTLSYNGNGNTSGSPPSGANYNYNQTVTVAGPNTLARTGYTFAGWKTTAGGSAAEYAAGSTFSMPAANVSLYAHWVVQSCHLTIQAQSGGKIVAPGISPYEAPYDTDVGIEASAVDGTFGNHFTGWQVLSGAAYVAIANPSAASTTAKLTGDARIQANFSMGYSLTIYGHNVTPTSPAVAYKGQALSISTDQVYSAGGLWGFDHWASIAPSSDAASFAPSTSNSTTVTVIAADSAGSATIRAYYNGPF